MITLSNTLNNKGIIQEFLDETKKRINDGVEITFSRKANDELSELAIDHNISADDIEQAMLNLTIDNYYRGVDPSTNADFSVCAFSTVVGDDNLEIYLKYGLHVTGVQIYVFSNHIPEFPMAKPFNN
ncbi:hypothetical protein [Pedobacter xixiisoli]|uniref:Uncharacterized protein n=1 Tax=Pedobacter xixiisoli TaxID=1476464 RepID=A0A286A722_9SPHI|nr:hypothetical protein [Pedobacter xixiisoli]SOD17621.1 hypothetical protein SAMN06297358_2601 [Pedobacter xixiisoli]